MHSIRNIAFTHHNLELPVIGCLHLDDEVRALNLQELKNLTEMDELMYLSTCNRVEFTFTAPAHVDSKDVLSKIVDRLDRASAEDKQLLLANASIHEGEAAVRHTLEVASSLDSLVVGEREIITQVRTSYERSKDDGLTGEMLKLLVKKTVETAKKVFSQTNISVRPVSVVSLAYRQLKDWNLPLNSRVVVVGSGKTNTTLARFMHKHGYRDITIFNRTQANAQALANEVGGQAHALTDIQNHQKGFDILLTCTGSSEAVITKEVYNSLLNGEEGRKVVVDLAIPADVDSALLQEHAVRYIGVNDLKTVAEKNLKERKAEVASCKVIIDQAMDQFENELEARKVELAMRSVPEKVREIRKTATETVFNKEISSLDANSREVLDKILEYMEKKYISVPMKLAREIIVESKSAAS